MSAINIFSKLYKYILFLYIFLFCIEIILPGFISNNFDLNIVLGIAILIGILSIFFHKENNKIDIKSNLFVVILALIFGIYISFKTIEFNLNEKIILVLGICFLTIISISNFAFDNSKKLKNRLAKISVNKLFIKKIFIVLLLIILSVLVFFKIYTKNSLKENLVNSEITIKIYDTEDDKKDAKEFAKKLNNLGYYKVYYGAKSNDNTKDVFIYFDDKYYPQIEIISKELSDYYDNINLRPAKKDEKDNIVIIFGK